MKKNINLWNYSIPMVVILICLLSFVFIDLPDNSEINGAWKFQQGSVEQVLIISDGYFMHTTFDRINKKLIESRGGAYKFLGNELEATIEFDIQNKGQIGQHVKYNFIAKNNKLSTNLNGKTESWSMLDNGKGSMAGTWRSSGRMQDGKVVLNPPRARKTFKILTGTRFQWAAINAETKEFFGTGGGAYTFENGKYSETIEFFSRDSSRVGVSLTFDGKRDGDLWHHSGMSSKGPPIYEIWKIELKQ